MKQIKIFIASLFLLNSMAQADITLYYKSNNEISSILVSNGKVRIDKSRGSNAIIFDLEQDRLLILDFKKQEYINMEKMVEQVSIIQTQMKNMLEQQIKNMPPKDQEEMRQMLLQTPDVKAPVITVKKTGLKDHVMGIECERVMVTQNQHKDEMCIAPIEKIGMLKADFKTMEKLMKRMNDLANKAKTPAKQRPLLMPQDMGGVPIKNYSGAQRELIRVEHQPIKAYLFAIPKGYTEKQLRLLN